MLDMKQRQSITGSDQRSLHISVQMMACRLVGTKPLPVPVLEIVNSTIRKKHQPNLNRN